MPIMEQIKTKCKHDWDIDIHSRRLRTYKARTYIESCNICGETRRTQVPEKLSVSEGKAMRERALEKILVTKVGRDWYYSDYEPDIPMPPEVCLNVCFRCPKYDCTRSEEARLLLLFGRQYYGGIDPVLLPSPYNDVHYHKLCDTVLSLREKEKRREREMQKCH